MSVASFPGLDRAATSHGSRFEAWAQWFIQPAVLIRFVLYATALLYLRTVLFDYVYDDTTLITLNPWMGSWKQLPNLLTHSFWGFLEIPRALDFYRPLVSLVFALILRLLGPAPGWFHLVAAGLHVCVTYLVYRLASETIGDPTVAAIAAGIFGLHPTRVETGAWISGISDSLSVVFLLSSMIAYFEWKRKGEGDRRHLAVSAFLLLLALFSKEAAIFAPILIAIYEFSACRSRFRDRLVTALGAVWPFLAVVAFALATRFALVRNPVAHGLSEIPVRYTIFTAPRAILWYAGKQIWPGQLSVEYPVMLVRGFSFGQFVLPLLVLSVLCIAGFWAVRKAPAGLFFASWFLLMLAPPILYLVTLQEHDRYSYLPSVASSIGLGYLLGYLRRLGAEVQATVLLTLLAVMTGLTFTYESYWDNDTKLFTHAVEIAPDNPKAEEYLASELVGLGQPEKAEAIAQRIISDPNQSAEGWYILGDVWLSQNRYQDAHEAFRNSLELSQGEKKMLWSMDLASTDLKLGRYEEAAQIYRDQIRKHPDLAFLHHELADTLKVMGKSEEAAKELELQRHFERE